MAPNFRPTSFSGDAGPFSVRNELSHAGLSAGVETQLTQPTDVGQAHHFFTPGSAAHAVGNVAISAPIGNAAIAAPMGTGAEAALMPMVPGASEPVSPLIQLIMRMPGQLGLFSSFFEALGNFLLPHLQAIGLDPSLLDIHAHIASMGNIHLPGAEHLAIDPGMLPDGAPILHSNLSSDVNHISLTKQDGLLNHSEPTDVDPTQVAGGPDVNSPQFEGSQPGHNLSGPAMSDSPVGNHLSGTQRLFSDRFQGSFFSKPAMQGSLLAGGGTPSSVSVSANSALNVSGSAFGAQPSAAAAVGQVGDGMSGAIAPAGGSLDGATASYSGGDNQLVATNNGADTFRPSYASHSGDGTNYMQQSSAGDAGNAHSPTASQQHGSMLKPLKAKELSLESLTKPGHKALDTASSAAKSSAQSGAGAAAKQAAHSVASGTKVADASFRPSHHAASHVDKAPAAHETSHPAKSIANKVEGTKDLAKIADKSVKVSGAEKPVVSDLKPTSYTIRAGDCLWNIAKDHLGSSMKWQDIYNMNQDIIGGNPDMIHTGATIKLPGSQMDLASAGTEATKYVVKPGDCLWDIAKDQMHDATKWGDLYKANTDVIGSNPRLITPGEELIIPGSETAVVADAGSGASSSVGQLADASGVGAQSAPASEFGSPAAAGDGSATSMSAQTVEVQPQVDMQSNAMQPAPMQPATVPQQQFQQPVAPQSQPSFHHMIPTLQGGPGAAIPAPASHVSHAMGPGAAGAAEQSATDALQAAASQRGIVNSSLGSDLASFLKSK